MDCVNNICNNTNDALYYKRHAHSTNNYTFFSEFGNIKWTADYLNYIHEIALWKHANAYPIKPKEDKNTPNSQLIHGLWRLYAVRSHGLRRCDIDLVVRNTHPSWKTLTKSLLVASWKSLVLDYLSCCVRHNGRRVQTRNQAISVATPTFRHNIPWSFKIATYLFNF